MATSSGHRGPRPRRSQEAKGIIEEELLESTEEAGDHSYVEHVDWSAVREVVAWLRALNNAPELLIADCRTGNNYILM